MNENNLIPFNKRTESEQREIAAEGGKKSGEARRKKRDMKKTMEMLLELSPGTQEDYDNLSAAGVDLDAVPDDGLNNMLVVNAALLNKAKSGDVNAIKELRSIIHDDDNYTKHKMKVDNAWIRLEKQKLEPKQEKVCDDGLIEALSGKAEEVFADEDTAVLGEATESDNVVAASGSK